MYQHAWRRQYSDNGVRDHEYIWTLKHTESGLVFLVLSKVSMIELNQYHASEYNQNHYTWFLQANQILNSLHTIEVNLRSTTLNRQSIVYLWLYIGLIYVDK